MIDINLLPHHLRPIKRTPIPYLASGVVLIGVVLFVVMQLVGTQAAIMAKNRELKQNQKALDDLQDIVKQFNALVAKKKQVADKIATIDEIASDRIIWSRQLFNLGRLAPENFWYSGIQVDKKKVKENETQIDPKTKQETVKTITVDRPILKVTGFVVTGADGTDDVNPLLLATDKDDEFSKLFQLETLNLEFKEFDGRLIRSFAIEYLIQQEDEKAKEAKKAAENAAAKAKKTP